jgi:heme-degrading monooxygenase HmoA
MFVRVGTFRVSPGTFGAFRDRYYSQCAPLVHAAGGNLDCLVLEPVDERSPVAVCTMWQSEADATAYEASGSAAEVVATVREFFLGPPELHSYRVRRP